MPSNLRKIIFYLPAIIFGFFYGVLVISGELVDLRIAIIWLGLFVISGFILSKNYFRGSSFGLLPAIHIIYMGTRDTGQIINEIPIGITIFIFYIICGYIAYRNKINSNSH
ncbi:hypothetical protein [Virgibacillus halodenitrificans]|uniref:hypothetical protein n=1 Tax=Virgibacillus halodenitrificans TaxID=1482 RepID=UPI0002E1940B|nr:hypothetical protein [Virgibacillus halodenitrificans]